MKEELKYEYYTPNIQELKVGLELEVGLKDGDLKWIPTTISEKDIIGNVPIYLAQNESYVLLNCPLRIRYLIEQDIINEGWKFRETGRSKFYKRYNKTEFALNYNIKTNMLFIEKAIKDVTNTVYDYSWINNDYIFVGKCRCINEFRTICKLLEI